MAQMSLIDRYTLAVAYTLFAVLIFAATLLALVLSSIGIAAFLLVVALLALPYVAAQSSAWLKQRVSLGKKAQQRQHMQPQQRLIVQDDGQEMLAWVVPLEQKGDHQMLLTSRGYVLVNHAGRVVHRLHEQ